VERRLKAVLDVRLDLGPVGQGGEDGRTVFSAPAVLTLLYLDEDDAVWAASRSLTVASRLECSEGEQWEARCFPEGEVFAAPVPGGAEVRFAVGFQVQKLHQQSVVLLKAARLGEPDSDSGEGERPSIVLRRMERDESLWDVAKQCRTTRAAILSANELEREEDCGGRMLLIPRVR
jgi:hypothetical protein